MKNPKVAVVLAIIAVVVLGFGGYKFLGWYQGGEVEVMLKCKDTGEVVKMTLPGNTEFPYPNPKNENKKTFYKADRYYCQATQKNVYMIPEIEEIPPTMIPGGQDGAATVDKPVAPVVEEPEEN